MSYKKIEYPCHCGRKHTYSNQTVHALVNDMIKSRGETIEVTASNNKTYIVPRRYISFHGLKEAELPSLGFEEVK